MLVAVASLPSPHILHAPPLRRGGGRASRLRSRVATPIGLPGHVEPGIGMTAHQRRSLRSLRRSLRGGALPRTRPDRTLRARLALRRWGPTPAGACQATAACDPDRVAIADGHREVTFADVHRRTDALACALAEQGVRAHHKVAIVCRNHHLLVETEIACSKLGTSVVHLDTAPGGMPLSQALRRLEPRLVVYDQEFSRALGPQLPGTDRLLAWHDRDRQPCDPLLEDLIAESATHGLKRVPDSGSRTVTLGARSGPAGWSGCTVAGSLLIPGTARSAVPLHPRETTMICAPLSSQWGHLHLTLALRLASTVVLRRDFDALETLAAIERRRVNAVALLPEMLEAIVGLSRETLAWYDTGSLRVIAVRGQRVPGKLALPAIAHFGAVLYSRHGPSIVTLGPELAQPLLGFNASVKAA